MENKVNFRYMGDVVYRQKFNDMSDVALQLMIQYAECGDDNSVPVVYDEVGEHIIRVRPDVAEMVRRMAYRVVSKNQHRTVEELRAVYEGRDWYIPALRIWFSDVVSVALDIWNLSDSTAELFAKMDEHEFTDEDQIDISMDIQWVALCVTNHCFVTPPVYYTPASLMAEDDYELTVYCSIYKVIVAGEVCGFLPKEMVWLTHKINSCCKAFRDGKILFSIAEGKVKKWFLEIVRWMGSDCRKS